MLPLSTGEGAHLTEASPTEAGDSRSVSCRLRHGYIRAVLQSQFSVSVSAQCHRALSGGLVARNSPGRVELLERKMRGVARIIIGRSLSTLPMLFWQIRS